MSQLSSDQIGQLFEFVQAVKDVYRSPEEQAALEAALDAPAKGSA